MSSRCQDSARRKDAWCLEASLLHVGGAGRRRLRGRGRGMLELRSGCGQPMNVGRLKRSVRMEQAAIGTNLFRIHFGSSSVAVIAYLPQAESTMASGSSYSSNWGPWEIPSDGQQNYRGGWSDSSWQADDWEKKKRILEG